MLTIEIFILGQDFDKKLSKSHRCNFVPAPLFRRSAAFSSPGILLSSGVPVFRQPGAPLHFHPLNGTASEYNYSEAVDELILFYYLLHTF